MIKVPTRREIKVWIFEDDSKSAIMKRQRANNNNKKECMSCSQEVQCYKARRTEDNYG